METADDKGAPNCRDVTTKNLPTNQPLLRALFLANFIFASSTSRPLARISGRRMSCATIGKKLELLAQPFSNQQPPLTSRGVVRARGLAKQGCSAACLDGAVRTALRRLWIWRGSKLDCLACALPRDRRYGTPLQPFPTVISSSKRKHAVLRHKWSYFAFPRRGPAKSLVARHMRTTLSRNVGMPAGCFPVGDSQGFTTTCGWKGGIGRAGRRQKD
jgi:hypothetical protein